MGLFEKLAGRKNTTADTPATDSEIQRAAVATAFAEADEHDTARAILSSGAPAPKILVVGREDRFSDRVVNYAVEMAARLRAELVALNVSETHLSLPVTYREDACKMFQGNAEANCSRFRNFAEVRGVPFSHLVRFGDQDDVIEEVNGELDGAVRYVVTEPESRTAASGMGEAAIPVFGLIPRRQLSV